MAPNHLERQINHLIESGSFANPDEVLEHALALLSEEHRRERLQRALDESAADIAAGRTAELTPELVDRIKAEGRRRVREGRRLDPDVDFSSALQAAGDELLPYREGVRAQP